VTGSIPYEPPYAFARRVSSLDHLTQGRMGWNIVTGYLDSAAKGQAFAGAHAECVFIGGDSPEAQGLAVGGGGKVITGSRATIADKLQHWFEVSGVDGFNLAYTVMPECVEDFVDLVVPELQERGIFKSCKRQGVKVNAAKTTHNPGAGYLHGLFLIRLSLAQRGVWCIAFIRFRTTYNARYRHLPWRETIPFGLDWPRYCL
jgi:alkanesulfonate monooxygenase SsuD/methylene tetrahydromethanopterin reductase-like flavin-dependent oxidoreductase (luciferase family)